MKIVVLDGYTLNPGDLDWSGMEKFGELTVHERSAPGQVAERLSGAEIVFTNKTPLTRQHFAAHPQIRFVGVLATGYNIVDVAAARQQGIAVSNVPAYSTMAVAQLATALLLELCYRVGRHSESVRAGDWAASKDFCYWLNPLTELDGKTLGIVGFGRIGQAFGRIGQALGMKILAFSERPKRQLESDTMRYVSLDALYANADVISLHCPLFESNKGMIDAAAIAKMKPDVLILNTSRGPLINEADLAAALKSGRVAGAAMDVLSSEPPAPDNPLLSAPNCIITPHIAWATQAARTRLMDIAVQNLAAFLDGSPQNVVNP